MKTEAGVIHSKNFVRIYEKSEKKMKKKWKKFEKSEKNWEKIEKLHKNRGKITNRKKNHTPFLK